MNRCLLVAHDVNQGILGFGQIRPLDDKYSELASLCVPQYHHQGVGSALVQEFLECANDGHQNMIIDAETSQFILWNT